MVVWRTSDIPDQTGRTAVVTGANSGIGLETTRALAAAGATVVMACRDRTRAEAAAATITPPGDGAVEVATLNLTDPGSIRSFAALMAERYGTIDLLINNAGVMACPPSLTASGVERQWATNHLGHFALTGLMLDTFVDRPARVVSVSSLAAAGGDLSGPIPTDLNDYARFQIYCDTKLANQVFAVELDLRLKAAGSPALSVAAHPGLAHTNLGASMAVPLIGRPFQAASRVFSQSAAAGALPTLRAAVDPDAIGAEYYGPGGRRQHRGPPVPIPLIGGADRRSVGRALWEQSMAMTGVRYLEQIDQA